MRAVLIGAGAAGASFAIVSRLRANWGDQLKIIITDIFDEHLVTTSLLADRFHKVPYANDPKFPEIIGNIILEEDVTTYIPILNDELIVAASLLGDDQFSHVDFWSSTLHASCTDKLVADAWLNSIGVRTPKIIDTKSDSDIEDDGPWFSKPRNGFGSKGVGVIDRARINELNPKDLDNLLIQVICEKPEVTIDSFFDATEDKCYSYCRERIETKSGVCTKARIFFDHELHEFAVKIGRALEQRGTICFQVMKSNNAWVVTDLNVRSGAGTAMTCAAGYDVLSAAYACRIGEDYGKYLAELPESDQIFVTRQYSEFVMSSH